MTFTRPENLHRHLETHAKQKRFVCEVCDAPFLHEGRLAVHRTIHAGNKLLAGKSPRTDFLASRRVTDQSKKHTDKNGAKTDCAGGLGSKQNTDQLRDFNTTTESQQQFVLLLARSTKHIQQCNNADGAVKGKQESVVEKLNPHSEQSTDRSLQSEKQTELSHHSSANVSQETFKKKN